MAARPLPHGAAHTSGVVIPLRSFTLGKARLADSLDDDERVAFVRSMAERVVAASRPRPIVVVSSAPEVVAWAAKHGLACLEDPGSLDAAATAGREWVIAQGLDRVVVVHADLPLATTLDGVADDGAARVAVVVPDRHGDGTPVIALPVDVDFAFAYGRGSCDRHVAEAERHQLSVRLARIPELGFDVDVPADLDLLDRDAERVQ
jgi:2-phospho-L-lactate guanylyltransferase